MKGPVVAAATNQVVLSKEDMIGRATALRPILAQRADQCEKLRRIPDEPRDDFIRAGIVRMIEPVRYGGLGFDIDTLLETTLELGRGLGARGMVGVVWD